MGSNLMNTTTVHRHHHAFFSSTPTWGLCHLLSHPTPLLTEDTALRTRVTKQSQLFSAEPPQEQLPETAGEAAGTCLGELVRLWSNKEVLELPGKSDQARPALAGTTRTLSVLSPGLQPGRHARLARGAELPASAESTEPHH